MDSHARHLLTAIRDECDSRRGPCPRHLVPIAVNARGHDIAMTEAHIDQMLCLDLIRVVHEPGRGDGLRLTGAGLDALARTEPSRDADAPCALPDDDHLLAESYSLVLDCADALARHQRPDPTLLSLYQRIETHCKTLWQRQEQKEASCAD
ncbi:hypothetical protein [Chromohalobacter israelensis]|uniref:hypothetical protein n=1 Tax=Chromohalobacter israelensis TaxID=141390 RepID=UPI00265BCC41|nr:hypothetical protein [Chromohalobacter salexigens]MDO0944639.1 hypothetical protein [Chromohalobacter salexigens]